jgi:hypothetical protein
MDVWEAALLLFGMVLGAQMALILDPDTSLTRLESLICGMLVPIVFPFVVVFRTWKFGRWRQWISRRGAV